MTEKTLTRKGARIRRRMIDTTARILREQGFRGATVRRIAGEAHVNISSVRYYFGSKEHLIALAMDALLGNLEEAAAFLDDLSIPPSERLRRYIRAYVPLVRQHPSLFRTLSGPPDSPRDPYFVYLAFLHEQYWPKFTATVADAFGLTDRSDAELKSLEILSAIEFPLLLERAAYPTGPCTDPRQLDRYLTLLLGPAPDDNVHM